MASFISKQPNGLYCRFSTVCDCPTHYNMTKEDYLNNVTGSVISREDGEDILENWLFDFDDMIYRFSPSNMSQSEFDEIIKEMSSTEYIGYKTT